MKPKFKIGDIVEFKNGNEFHPGTTNTIAKVEAIHMTHTPLHGDSEGIKYSVSGTNQFVEEAQLSKYPKPAQWIPTSSGLRRA